MEPDCQERWAEVFRSRGAPPRVMEGRYRFSLDAPTLLVDAFRRGDAIGVDQVVDLGVSRSAAGPSASVRATACLPLVVSETLVGGLYLFWTKKRSLVEDERTFAGTLADLCAQALDRARLFTAERDAREPRWPPSGRFSSIRAGFSAWRSTASSSKSASDVASRPRSTTGSLSTSREQR